MNSNQKKIRGLGLCSGGLDSMLSGLVLRRQGVEVEWITFVTPFFGSEKARKASRETGIPLTVVDITDRYLPMLMNPPCGYGKHMNPCLDCHALMFNIAGRMMRDKGFDFLFSGEVLGQRPMSQTRPSLRYVEKHSGFDGYILRPLCAKKLSETIPETRGMVNRELLFDITGRSRKRQIKLAEKFRITEYPAPAGGCLLTDKGFSTRLKDLFDHRCIFDKRELHLLKYGRHLRLNDKTKIIVGRTQADNDHIIGYYSPKEDIVIEAAHIPGPVVLVPFGGTEEMIRLSASVCAGYTKASKGNRVEVQVTTPYSTKTFWVEGIYGEHLKGLMV